jgi:hypothetical protein
MPDHPTHEEAAEMTTDAKPRPLLVTAETLLDMIPVGPDMLHRWVCEGMPCMWTGGRPGVGIRLFHVELVEDWCKARMLGTASERFEADDDDEPRPTRQPSRRGKAACKVNGKYVI